MDKRNTETNGPKEEEIEFCTLIFTSGVIYCMSQDMKGKENSLALRITLMQQYEDFKSILYMSKEILVAGKKLPLWQNEYRQKNNENVETEMEKIDIVWTF